MTAVMSTQAQAVQWRTRQSTYLFDWATPKRQPFFQFRGGHFPDGGVMWCVRIWCVALTRLPGRLSIGPQRAIQS